MTPQLRFPEFTDEWQVKRLGDIFEVTRGYVLATTRTRQTQDDNYQYPVYSSQTKNDGLMGYYTDYLYENAITWTTDGANAGAVKYRSGKFYCTNVCGVLISKEGYANKAVAESLNLVTYKYVSYVGNPKLMNGTMSQIPITLPEIDEQEKIAEFLTAVDKRIAAGKKKLELLQKYKKGVMQKIFTKAIRFKDEHGNPYSEWEVKRLGDVFDEVKRKVGETQVETYSITAGVGFVSQRSKFGKDISGNQNKNYTLLRQNEFSYNKGNSKTYAYGCVYANKGGGDIAVPNVFISFKLHDNDMFTDFFEQLFIGHYLDRYLRQIISSGARMDGLLNVNKTDFFAIKVPVPAPKEQQKIATFLTALDAKIAAEQTRLTAAKQWKKGLLQRMFV